MTMTRRLLAAAAAATAIALSAAGPAAGGAGQRRLRLRSLLSPAPAAGQRTRRSLAESSAAPGTLLSILPDGQPAGLCPLVHTDVKADISGPLARVTVEQEFIDRELWR